MIIVKCQYKLVSIICQDSTNSINNRTVYIDVNDRYVVIDKDKIVALDEINNMPTKNIKYLIYYRKQIALFSTTNQESNRVGGIMNMGRTCYMGSTLQVK